MFLLVKWDLEVKFRNDAIVSIKCKDEISIKLKYRTQKIYL